MFYGKYFTEGHEKREAGDLCSVYSILNRLNQGNLCPFAAHAIFPYIFSFQRGSWFRWMKSKDSVIVQCPNPDSCVAFKVTKKGKGDFLAEVISVKKSCLAGYKTKDAFMLGPGTEAVIETGAWCHLNMISSLSVSVVGHSKLCRYYQKPGQAVSFNSMVPAGFCLPAYYVAYPYSLCLLYDGSGFEKNGKETTASFCCPNKEGNIRMQVSTRRNVFSLPLDFVEKTLRLLGHPKDVLDKSIRIKVMGAKGDCIKALSLGCAVDFNLRNRQELCPAVFYTLFPYLAMLNTHIFPYWAKNKESVDIHCPDPAAEIVYRIAINNKHVA